jgi:hypothetical protein
MAGAAVALVLGFAAGRLVPEEIEPVDLAETAFYGAAADGDLM